MLRLFYNTIFMSVLYCYKYAITEYKPLMFFRLLHLALPLVQPLLVLVSLAML